MAKKEPAFAHPFPENNSRNWKWIAPRQYKWIHNGNTVTERSQALCRDTAGSYQAFQSTWLLLKMATQKGVSHAEMCVCVRRFFFFNVLFPFSELSKVDNSVGEKNFKKRIYNNWALVYKNNKEKVKIYLRKSKISPETKAEHPKMLKML